MTDKYINVIEKDTSGGSCVVTSSLQPLSGGMNPNIIINGDMRIAQRGTSASAGVASAFSVDRFGAFATGSASGAWDIKQATVVPDESPSTNSLQADVVTADTSIGNSELYMIRYQLEGYDAARLKMGGAGAQAFTLSFWVRSPKTGIHCVAFKNAAQDRVFVATYDVTTADTNQKVEIPLTGDISGTWLVDNSIGMQICWLLAAGTDWHTTAGSWLAGDDYCTSAQVNCIDNADNNFYLADVKLEIGSAATPFVPRSIAQELSLCQRYYFKTYRQGINPGNSPDYSGDQTTFTKPDGLGNITIPFPVILRSTATGSATTIYAPQTGATGNITDQNNQNIPAVLSAGGDGRCQISTSQTTTAGWNVHAHITIDVEL